MLWDRVLKNICNYILEMNIIRYVLAVSIGLTAYLCAASILSEKSTILSNHHTNEEVFDIIDQVNKKCPDITYVYDLGLKSVNGVPLRVIVFSDNPSKHELGEPEFKFVGNMHGNEVIGRELMLELMVQLCDSYLDQNENVVKLLTSTRIHLLTTMNPDGWQAAVDNEFETLRSAKNFSSKTDMLLENGVTEWLTGRQNAKNVDLNRNFPDLDKYYYEYVAEKKNKFDHLIEEASEEINQVHKDCQGKPVSFQRKRKIVQISWLSAQTNNLFVIYVISGFYGDYAIVALKVIFIKFGI